jgi:hypothetical protein
LASSIEGQVLSNPLILSGTVAEARDKGNPLHLGCWRQERGDLVDSRTQGQLVESTFLLKEPVLEETFDTPGTNLLRVEKKLHWGRALGPLTALFFGALGIPCPFLAASDDPKQQRPGEICLYIVIPAVVAGIALTIIDPTTTRPVEAGPYR